MTITMKRASIVLVALASLCFVLGSAPALAQRDLDGEYSDDVRQTVARVAYLSGPVAYDRGDDPDDWQRAALNFPMTMGDRLYAGRGGRAEVQVEDGTIYVGPETDLGALNLTDDVRQLSLGLGTASFRIRRLDSSVTFEVDTPNASITFERPGVYRIDVSPRGDTRVQVRRGFARVAAGGGEVPLSPGRLMQVDGVDPPTYDVTSLTRTDSWDRWVEQRAGRNRVGRSHVNVAIFGAEELDAYGTWRELPGYGSCWGPFTVTADWRPYRDGRWVWQDPWGWSWVSFEPWGWAPYHYGRWVTYRARWYWVPERVSARGVRYAPALVAFVSGPGLPGSIGASDGGFVGWFPLAPRERLMPWWGSGARRGEAPADRYANRAFTTVAAERTFVRGEPVRRDAVRDSRARQEVASAPVVGGTLRVVPQPAALRVAPERGGPAPRPPAHVADRGVVTRLAPPPPPATFRAKVDVIRRNQGAPVAPAEAAHLPVEHRAVPRTRSVIPEGGRVALVPKGGRVAGPAPVPVVTREQQLERRRAPVEAAQPPLPEAGRPQVEESRRRQADGAPESRR